MSELGCENEIKLKAKTLYEKIWCSHLVDEDSDGNCLLYIDRHIVHEVTSAQAFEGLRMAGRSVRRPGSILAVADHQVPTTDRHLGLAGFEDLIAREQVQTLDSNCDSYGIRQFKLNDTRQGIVHVVGPEQGATLPGMTLVCGDSHTSTHGAFAALAQGIGTSEVEHVLATQTLRQRRSKTLKVEVEGLLPAGSSAKDLSLEIIFQLSCSGATGYVIEYCGAAVEAMTMAERMTLCNMSIEAGARAGLIAFDAVTENYLHGLPFAPSGDQWPLACEHWRGLRSDEHACFDKVLTINADAIAPRVSWGTKPDQSLAVDGCVPDPLLESDLVKRDEWQQALNYMGLVAGERLSDVSIDRIFIGSCTNGRLDDLRAAAELVKGKKIAANIRQAMVVPGSGLVKAAAEREGLDQIFIEAGFEWRSPGCSMCNAMNPDKLLPGERCASTSNRNFEGRQGALGRTHIMSPIMAAAAALAGHLCDVRQLLRSRG